jgi:CheY-like chemotaxis protein
MSQSPRPIRVLIVDDIPETRTFLEGLLAFEDDIDTMGTAANANEAIAMTKALKPDVVLLDIDMPGMSGIDAVPAVLDAHPGVRVVMMSVQYDPGTSGRRPRLEPTTTSSCRSPFRSSWMRSEGPRDARMPTTSLLGPLTGTMEARIAPDLASPLATCSAR